MSNVSNIVRGLIHLMDPAGSSGLGNHYLEEWHDGTTFLEVLLKNVKACHNIDHVVAYVHPELPQKARDLLEFYSVQPIELPDLKSYAGGHDRIISSRKWGYQNWNGSPTRCSIYDETMPMGLVGHFNELTSPSKMVVFSPEMPFVNPQATDHMIKEVSKDYEETRYDVLAMYYPMGMSPLVISGKALKDLETYKVWLPQSFFALKIARYPIKMRSFLHFPKLDNERRSFMLRSRRDVERLRAWNGKIEDMKPLDDRPREIQLELTSTPHDPKCRLPQLKETEPIALSTFKQMLQQCQHIDDLLLTIGDLGRLHGHPQLNEIRELLMEHKPYGVHAIFEASDVFEDIIAFGDWFCSGFDIITIRLTSMADDPDELRSQEDKIALISKLYIKSELNTVINFEIHKYAENWRSIHVIQEWEYRYGISFTWTGYNDYAGQLPSGELPTYSPRKRGPCEKLLHQLHLLPNGEITLCRQAFEARESLGRFPDQSILDLWGSTELQHYRDETVKEPEKCHQLCAQCKHSHFV